MQTNVELTPTEVWNRYRNDWILFAEEILNVYLDDQQKECLESIQNNPRISIRSGNARGKDFVAAVASLCFLYLNNPSKVIETAPTGRQVISIIMAEIKKIHGLSRIPLGGELLSDTIKFPDDPTHYLMAFKSGEKEVEPWSGFHSPSLMVVVTEASGIEDLVFTAMESILTGDSKLVLCFNPYRLSGEAFRSITSPMYKKHCLNCLDAPNVIAKKQIIPGQVDYGWIRNLIENKGWVTQIEEDQVQTEKYDFEWEGRWYRPNDLFRVKVLGEPPKESEDVLIPLAWLEASFDRWERMETTAEKMKIGVDVAGLGRDFTVFCLRRNMIVEKFVKYSRQDHMATVGKLKEIIGEAEAYIDTIGEGAGVYSRARELKMKVVSAKFSESAKGLKDYSGERAFVNMRAYCYWAIRDALDPQYPDGLALPRDDELAEELHETKWKIRSSGEILIEDKEEIKKRLGRSPDKADSLALSFYPKRHHGIHV